MGTLPDLLLSISLGIALAAATGLRVFLPLFIASVFAHFDIGGIGLRDGFGWLSEWPAMLALGIATVMEALAYYIPVLDHLLDTIAVPLAAIAGTVVAMSTFVDLPPLLSWGLAIIAGGGLAGLISAGTAVTRVASTTTTAGIGNPIVATLETVGALLISLVALFLPFVGLLLVALVIRTIYRIHRAKRTA